METSNQIWIDVGAYEGAKSLPWAQADFSMVVYAFEPNLFMATKLLGRSSNYVVLPMAVSERTGYADFYKNNYEAASSLLPFDPEGLERWKGGDRLRITEKIVVPTVRLDEFMESTGISRVDFLKIDAQGADLAVLRSLGDRIWDVKRILLEVQLAPLYRGAATKEEVLDFLSLKEFRLVSAEFQTFDQEENLSFERV